VGDEILLSGVDVNIMLGADADDILKEYFGVTGGNTELGLFENNIEERIELWVTTDFSEFDF